MIELHGAHSDHPVIALNPRYVIQARRHREYTVVTVDLCKGRTTDYGVVETPEEIAAMSRPLLSACAGSAESRYAAPVAHDTLDYLAR